MDDALNGIDVSAYNGILNWQAIKKAGIEFAMIKATHGKTAKNHFSYFTDKCFVTNICHANSANVLCGVYHYFTAQTEKEAINEAQYFLNVIKPYKNIISLWVSVYIDDESFLSNLSKSELTALTQIFCNEVKAQGYKVCIYANSNYLRYKINLHELSQFLVWQSCWGDSKPPEYSSRLAIWQYGIGKLSGVNGQYSLNYGYQNLLNERI